MGIQRTFLDHHIKVWRAIANAGRQGTTLVALCDKFAGVIDEQPIKKAIDSLRNGNYIVGQPKLGYGVWGLTLETCIPMGETAPEWLFEKDEPCLMLDGRSAKRQEPAQDRPVNSVFAQATCEPAAHAAPARIEAEPSADFECGLSSKGSLYIRSGEVAQALPLSHTRQLLHYLDHLNASALAENVNGGKP